MGDKGRQQAGHYYQLPDMVVVITSCLTTTQAAKQGEGLAVVTSAILKTISFSIYTNTGKAAFSKDFSLKSIFKQVLLQ